MHTHLTRVHLKGFRNIQDTETTFREGLNIIIGPNGCGKTNFLWLLANIYTDNTNHTKITAQLTIYNENFSFENSIVPVSISHEFNVNENKVMKGISIGISNNTGPDVKFLFKPYHLFLNFNLIPYALNNNLDCFSNGKTITIQKEIIPNTEKRFFRADSNNIVVNRLIGFNSFNWMKNQINNLGFSNEVIKILKKYSPIEDIRAEFPQREDEIKENEDEIRISNLMYGFKIYGEWFKWDELSDGSRKIVWIILNILLSAEEIILIEEPELGIHPHQLKLLMQFIKEQSQHKQIILTTHAPEVLDILDADELDRIKIARYDEVKQTTIIEGIPEKRQAIIQKYLQKTGLLSGFWSRIDLEGTKGFPKQ